MNFITKLKKEFGRKVTVMFIHHGNMKPLRLSISLFFLCLVVILWTGLTLWAGYLASRHIDYAMAKTNNKIMEYRILFFADQIEKTKDMFEKVQVNDSKLRSLLALRTRKAIIEDNIVTEQALGEGGPTEVQSAAFFTLIAAKSGNVDYSYLAKQTENIAEQYQYIQKSYSEIISHVKYQRSLFIATPRGWPAEGIITSHFGFRRNPFLNSYRDFHSGIDIANVKNTSVNVTANGVVVFSGWQSGYGNIVVVDHGYDYRSAYAHLNQRYVQVGDTVKRGQTIGGMGATGTATGSHVHYEVHFKGKSINPFSYLTDHFFSQQEGG
ncbi:MAG: M23 family metallopeptidase [Elusimicrobiota bacterium]|nr:M23 family metallopeptidase [Elusimicrobiota bacterium]